jgi:hypothetical protein
MTIVRYAFSAEITTTCSFGNSNASVVSKDLLQLRIFCFSFLSFSKQEDGACAFSLQYCTKWEQNNEKFSVVLLHNRMLASEKVVIIRLQFVFYTVYHYAAYLME